MTVRWRIYDLGREYHGAPTTSTDGRQGPPERRYFIAGVDDDARPWTPDHRYTLEVAQKIIVWKNAWEDLILEQGRDMKRYRIRDRGALYRAIYGSGERFIVSGMTYPINDDEYPYVDIRVPDKICKWLNDWERARRKATRLVLGLDLR